MDINLLRAIATVLMFVTFVAICVWAFSGKRKKRFEEAAQLPFADDDSGEKKTANPESSKEER